MALNEAGDRKAGNFVSWVVCGAGSSFSWKRAAVYRPTSGAMGTLLRLPGCGG